MQHKILHEKYEDYISWNTFWDFYGQIFNNIKQHAFKTFPKHSVISEPFPDLENNFPNFINFPEIPWSCVLYILFKSPSETKRQSRYLSTLWGSFGGLFQHESKYSSPQTWSLWTAPSTVWHNCQHKFTIFKNNTLKMKRKKTTSLFVSSVVFKQKHERRWRSTEASENLPAATFQLYIYVSLWICVSISTLFLTDVWDTRRWSHDKSARSASTKCFTHDKEKFKITKIICALKFHHAGRECDRTEKLYVN